MGTKEFPSCQSLPIPFAAGITSRKGSYKLGYVQLSQNWYIRYVHLSTSLKGIKHLCESLCKFFAWQNGGINVKYQDAIISKY